MDALATSSSTTSPKTGIYFPVLDALRFVLAFWVAVGHYKMFPLFADPRSGPLAWALFKRFYETIVFGTPAVIVFFVISGFCIHLPFCGTTKIDIGRYYLRRYTRILIPVAGALIVYRLAGQNSRLQESIQSSGNLRFGAWPVKKFIMLPTRCCDG